MKREDVQKLPPCGCVDRLNGALKEHNTQVVAGLFGQRRIVVATCKVDEKRRGKAALVVASFCPFCGASYGDEAERSAA